MASIDINKLIQESMSTVMTKPEGDNVDPNTDVNDNSGNTDDNMNTLHESMKTVVEADLKLAGEYLRGEKKIPGGDNKVDLAKAGKMMRGETDGKVMSAVKKVGSTAKELVQDHPRLAAAGAAGAAGLVGAGVMAKKYLARKKAGK